ncbi:UPF0158 family protein [Kitasatospora aureofaciens]|uniref:UPF0158 family protein n=1 Tax=Kitasatospora aureofaciens TaxID=1894 RepID=UPI000A822083|nr:UPF0158 family protein [Kitasatospora aureofaciens]
MRGTWSEENLRRLRAARHAGDGAALVALLSGLPFAEVLQQVGEAAGDAVTARVPGAADLAERCIAALGERDWEGDAELARQLGAALGRGAMPPLRPLPVDLEELSGVLEGDPVLGGGRIDLTTGDCRPQLADSDEQMEDDEDPERWLPVWCEGSRDGYRDMELFTATIGDADFADRLGIAISGRGAFRRFKDVLARREDELRRFHLFAEERQRGRARAWLAGNGYRPVARP